MQFQKYRLWENAILATIRDLHFFLINWIYERSEQHLENRMTVRKGIPRQGKHRNEPLRDKMSRSPGSVPTPEHAAGMGQEAFSGRTATESKMEETHEREPI